ncbi:MAG: hypothetical protein GEV06_09585 [Luteitalea sp.]|nr:hypothetical protein [Luteitalea sp.]
MIKARINGLVFRMLVLAGLMGAFFAAPVFAQQPICRAQCLEAMVIEAQYCLLTNPGGIGSLVCGFGAAVLSTLCGVLCIITG